MLGNMITMMEAFQAVLTLVRDTTNISKTKLQDKAHVNRKSPNKQFSLFTTKDSG